MIVRGERPEINYTIIENKLINDPALDWRELGLLIYLLSKPDNWQISITHLAQEKQTGESGIKSAIKKLKVAGYISSKRHHTGRVDWYVYDTPMRTVEPQAEKPQVEKPHVEKPQEENHLLINTDNKTNKEKENNGVPFDAFWEAYGHKKNKSAGEKAWKKLNEKDRRNALGAVPAFKKSLPDWHALPYPASYLNGRRWDDDLSPSTVNGQPIQKIGSQKPFEKQSEIQRAAPTKGGKKTTLKELVKDLNKRVA